MAPTLNDKSYFHYKWTTKMSKHVPIDLNALKRLEMVGEEVKEKILDTTKQELFEWQMLCLPSILLYC